MGKNRITQKHIDCHAIYQEAVSLSENILEKEDINALNNQMNDWIEQEKSCFYRQRDFKLPESPLPSSQISTKVSKKPIHIHQLGLLSYETFKQNHCKSMDLTPSFFRDLKGLDKKSR